MNSMSLSGPLNIWEDEEGPGRRSGRAAANSTPAQNCGASHPARARPARASGADSRPPFPLQGDSSGSPLAQCGCCPRAGLTPPGGPASDTPVPARHRWGHFRISAGACASPGTVTGTEDPPSPPRTLPGSGTGTKRRGPPAGREKATPGAPPAPPGVATGGDGSGTENAGSTPVLGVQPQGSWVHGEGAARGLQDHTHRNGGNPVPK